MFSPYQLNPMNIKPLRDALGICVEFSRVRDCTNFKLYISATNTKTGKVKVLKVTILRQIW